MAQSVNLWGATYSDVPAIEVPKSGGGMASFTDVTDTTAVASDVAQGKYFFTAAGQLTLGTGSGGGGASSWTKVAETSYQVNTTNTSASTVATWETGHSEIWTSNKWVYVRVRDTEGRQNGYFYGSDNFFINKWIVSGAGNNNVDTGIRYTLTCASNGTAYGASPQTGTTGYGVYADNIYSDGRVRIRQRYHSSYSYTINSTYKVEVYLLDPAGGVPIFG